MSGEDLLLACCMFVGAALYTSVGHGGASAYLALMGLFGVAPAVMRPTALVLNVVVASFTSVRYARAGQFRWRTLWPFLVGALPFAFIGGALTLPGSFYKPLLGVLLWIAAVRLLWPKELAAAEQPHPPPIGRAILCGGGIGLLSGLTGTGGGIFLSPLLLFFGWSDPRTASGVVALFILCNSLAGLSGNLASVRELPALLPLYAISVLGGAVVGTSFGIRFRSPAILRALGLVLIVAGFKLVGLY